MPGPRDLDAALFPRGEYAQEAFERDFDRALAQLEGEEDQDGFADPHDEPGDLFG